MDLYRLLECAVIAGKFENNSLCKIGGGWGRGEEGGRGTKCIMGYKKIENGLSNVNQMIIRTLSEAQILASSRGERYGTTLKNGCVADYVH